MHDIMIPKVTETCTRVELKTKFLLHSAQLDDFLTLRLLQGSLNIFSESHIRSYATVRELEMNPRYEIKLSIMDVVSQKIKVHSLEIMVKSLL